MDNFSIESAANGEVLVFIPAGRIDSITAPAFDAELAKIIKANKKVVIDFKNTAYLSSAGLRAVIRNLQNAEKAGGGLKLASIPAIVLEVLETTGMLHVVKPYATVEEAASDF
jgi:anti-anti-sigma factor